MVGGERLWEAEREPGAPAARSDAVIRLPAPCFCLEAVLGEGPSGKTWSAHVSDGSPVVAKALAVTSSDTAAAERAGRLGGPHLVPQQLLDHDGQLWAVAERGDEVALSALPSRLRRSIVVVVGSGILSGLARLHQDGLWHGSLKPSNILVGADGSVRLTHYTLTPAATEADRAATRLADVRAAGAILCRLMGIVPERSGSSEAAEPDLARAMRSIATMRRRRRSGYEATYASVALWEAAGRMGSRRAREQAAAQLGAAVSTALAGMAAGQARPQVALAPMPAPGTREGTPGRRRNVPEPVSEVITAPVPAHLRPPDRRTMSLERLAQLSPLDPDAIVAVTLDVLAALEAAPERPVTRAGIRIAENGAVSLGGDVRAGVTGQAEGVLAAGEIASQLLNVGADAAADATELAITLEALAMGALGRRPAAVRIELSRRLSLLAAPTRLEQARIALGERVRSAYSMVRDDERHVPTAALGLPAAPQRRLRPAGSILAVAGCVLGAVLVCAFVLSAVVIPAPRAAVAPRAAQPAAIPAPDLAPSAAPTAPPPPQAAAAAPPVVAPAAAGAIREVAVTLGPCGAGMRCTAETTIRFAGGRAATPLAWTIRFYNACGGAPITLGTGTYTAPAGWNTVQSESSVVVPSDVTTGWLVAVTSAPAEAASEPAAVSGRSC